MLSAHTEKEDTEVVFPGYKAEIQDMSSKKRAYI